jgi:DNA-binding LacI/PurR family transcriptional regulator
MMEDQKPTLTGGAAAGSRSPTSQDVARQAKVSRATVSYVLNNVEGAGISAATRQRVLQAADELGYIPHKFASSLRAGRSDLVLLPFINWPFNQNSLAFYERLAQGLDRLGYSVMLHFFGQSDKESLARKIAAFHPIGVIVGAHDLSPADVELLTRNGVRAILSYEASPDARVPSVFMDFAIVGKCVGEYFHARGHRDVAAIVPKDERIRHIGLQRLEGLHQAAAQSGLRVERVDLDYDMKDARTLALKWKSGPHPGAVFTYNDDYGLLLMGALQDAGLAIPGEIALVGCDDLPFCEMVRPRLTSVNNPSDILVENFVIAFHRMVQGQGRPDSSRLPWACRVILRDSG